MLSCGLPTSSSCSEGPGNRRRCTPAGHLLRPPGLPETPSGSFAGTGAAGSWGAASPPAGRTDRCDPERKQQRCLIWCFKFPLVSLLQHSFQSHSVEWMKFRFVGLDKIGRKGKIVTRVRTQNGRTEFETKSTWLTKFNIGWSNNCFQTVANFHHYFEFFKKWSHRYFF